jgi:RimJ/RimL family protein N-acetyltransferase
MTVLELGRNASMRKLLPQESHLLADHYLRLDSESRRLRFAHSVNDEYVTAHALRSAEHGSVVHAILIDGIIRAAAELKRMGGTWGTSAEAAFSVESEFTNQGFASELMGRIILSARNRGIRHLVMTCLAENAKMQAIARKYNAELHLEQSDMTADIVPKRRDAISIATEAFDDRFVLMLSALDFHARQNHVAEAAE